MNKREYYVRHSFYNSHMVGYEQIETISDSHMKFKFNIVMWKLVAPPAQRAFIMGWLGR